MPTTVRIKPEVITAHRLRIEMFGLEDEDIENTIRMKGWAWVLARRGWVYAGEPDFIVKIPNNTERPVLERGMKVKVGWSAEDCRALDDLPAQRT